MKTRAPFIMLFNAAISTLVLSQFVYAQTPPVPPAAPTSPTPPTAPALVYKDGVVKVGSELKQSRGRITDVSNFSLVPSSHSKQNLLISFLLKLNHYSAILYRQLDVCDFSVRTWGVIHVLPNFIVTVRRHAFVKHGAG